MFKAAQWRRHPALYKLLGLTPLLAVTARVVDAALFGVILLLTLLASSLCVALLREWIAPATRLLAVLIISAAVVSVADILSRAWLYGWHDAVGIYLPLVATSALLLAWLEEEAMTRPLTAVMAGAAGEGLAMFWLLLGLSGARELLGHGTLLDGLNLFPAMPQSAPWLELPGAPLPLLAEPAGGLLLLGLVYAICNHLRPEQPASVTPGQTG